MKSNEIIDYQTARKVEPDMYKTTSGKRLANHVIDRALLVFVLFAIGSLFSAGFSADADGMPAIFTPAGVGTEVAAGKEIREFNGKEYLLEYAFDADFALVKAWKGDTAGNLIYKETARNFNPAMAMAGKITIAEVEELVDAGQLDPNQVHTPGIYVHRIFQGALFEKRIEQRTVR